MNLAGGPVPTAWPQSDCCYAHRPAELRTRLVWRGATQKYGHCGGARLRNNLSFCSWSPRVTWAGRWHAFKGWQLYFFQREPSKRRASSWCCGALLREGGYVKGTWQFSLGIIRLVLLHEFQDLPKDGCLSLSFFLGISWEFKPSPAFSLWPIPGQTERQQSP